MSIENTTEMGIGEIIKTKRISASMSQNKLAEALSMDRTAISKWENGSSLPPVDKFAELCEILGAEPNEFFSQIINIQKIRMERKMTSENDKKQVYETETEALGGYRAMCTDFEAAKSECKTEEELEMWRYNNKFYFLYNLKNKTFSAIRSYGTCIFHDAYMFVTDCFPISSEWIDCVVSTEKNLRDYDEEETPDNRTTSQIEDDAIRDGIIRAVEVYENDLKEYNKLAEKSEKTVLFLLDRLYYSNYRAINPKTKEYYELIGYKSYEKKYKVIQVDGDGEKIDKDLDAGLFEIYIPSVELVNRIGADISRTELNYMQEWDMFNGERGEYETPDYVLKELEWIKNKELKTRNASDCEKKWAEVANVLNKLRTKNYNPVFIEHEILRSFELRLDRFLHLCEMRSPSEISAESLKLLHKIVADIEEALSLSDKYEKAEADWKNKIGNDAEEKLLQAIFGEKRNRISKKRPDPLSEEEIEAAERMYALIRNDKECAEYKAIEDYKKRMTSAASCTLVTGSEAFKWCMQKIYEEVKEDDIKNIVTFILPYNACINIKNNKENSVDENKKSKLIRQFASFRHSIDEIERGEL